MIKHAILGVLLLSSAGAAMLTAAAAPKQGIDWPMFRGIAASGVADGHTTPVKWDVAASQNVKWKTAIPGLGHSSPVIWGDQVCVATAISGLKDASLKVGLYGDIAPVDDSSVHNWKVYCVDKKTGAVRWERTAFTGVPKIKRHTKATQANSTLATDGEHVVAFFGSEGLYCYDMKGNLKWKKDLGVLDAGFFRVPEAQWGTGSSPIIVDGKLILQADVQKGSFLGAFDVNNGKEIWRTLRDDVPTWSTPALFTSGGRTQVVVNGFKHIGGYDLQTGKELWRMNGIGDIPVPTPIVLNDLVFVTNAHGGGAPVYAIRAAKASGDISLAEGTTTNDHIAWSVARDGSYMQTPVVYGDYLYVCKDNGVLSVFEATSGKRVYQERLADGKTGFTASAVAADGKVYYTSEDGDVYVVKAGPTFEVLGRNPLGEIGMATPAISEGVLFFRTQGHLVAIGGK